MRILKPVVLILFGMFFPFFLSANEMIGNILLIPRTQTPPIIDGEIDGVWCNVTNTFQGSYGNSGTPPNSPEDLTGWFRLLYDGTNFYGLFYTQDDVLFDIHTNVWENDGWEIYFDPDYSRGTSYDNVNDQQIRIEHRDKTWEEIDCASWVNKSRIKFVNKNTPKGYLLEFAIPLSELKLSPVAGTLLGFEAQQNDNDGTNREHVSKWWLKQGDDSWLNPSTFGTAKLSAEEASPLLPVYKAPSPPLIDGKLDEVWINNSWSVPMNSYSNGSQLPNSYEDLEGTFRMMWDENYYYGFFVTRDNVLFDNHTNVWENDGWEIYFDPDYSRGTSYDNVNDQQIRFEHRDKLPTDVDCASWMNKANIRFAQLDHSDHKGYNLEFAIPMQDLKLTPTIGKLFGFEAQQNDNDGSNREHVSKWWLKQGDDSWLNPSTFGTAVLRSVRNLNAQPPRVRIVYPQDGDKFELGSSILIRAQAEDPDGTIQSIQFFQDGIHIAEDTESPYQCTWTPNQTGDVSLYAIATDDQGLFTVSDSIHIRITSPSLPESPLFSKTHGFYNSPFDLTISWNAPGAVIRYTLDGSNPQTNPSSFEKPSPAVIRIDPNSTVGRGKTPGVVVRALALVNDVAVTQVGTQTYLFISKIKTQTTPGGNWPPPGRINGRLIDYAMDPNVVNNPRYKDLIDDAFMEIPSMCINTDLANLFDPATGIYVNPLGRGIEWERPASIELFDPRGREPGFQINGGIRIRGGYSRIGDQPKMAFRLFFRSEYGKAKLEYPLFQDEGASVFDCVDLRTDQNYSWSYMGSPACTFIRDVFSRDTQRDMGQPYTRSRYYHLFINGMYWGLYQTQERSEASYAETYFGGEKEQYDVIKVDMEHGYIIEATDGNLDAYNTLWNLAAKGFSTNQAYFKAQGKNPDGSENFSYPALLNVDNLIDYLLVIFYTGNFDSPVSAFISNNQGINNIYGIYDRLGRTGFLFFTHDAEHSLMDPRYSELPNEYGYDRTGPFYPSGMIIAKEYFNPQWLHERLCQNLEYRMRFADRTYKHFFNNGALTREACRRRFAFRRDEIDTAIIAESARWGDSKVYPARTKDNDWLPAVNWVLNNFFSNRNAIVLEQLKKDQLYPNIDPPVFMEGDREIQESTIFVSSGFRLRMTNPNTKGTIYYTVDGSDPRQIGGNIGPSALEGGNGKEIPISLTTTLKARVKDGTTWSALHELVIHTAMDFSSLRITELHYHPLDEGQIKDSEFEFIELKNIGPVPLPLSGLRFVEGIHYEFPSNAFIPPNGFIVLASNPAYFQARYGFAPFGEYNGQLENAGERIALVNASGDTILAFQYDDKAPWPEQADTAGYSLVAKDRRGEGDPNTPEYWRVSAELHGSPGRDDPASGIIEEPVAFPITFALDQNYPNPFNDETTLRFSIPETSWITLSVYNVLGREVDRLFEGWMDPGTYTWKWKPKKLPSGIYLGILKTKNQTKIKKMILMH